MVPRTIQSREAATAAQGRFVMSATVLKFPEPKLRATCAACGIEAGCDCNAPYVPAGARAAAAVAATPEKSNRAIAAEIDVSDKTVAAARKRGAEYSATERVGKDGKKYKAAKPRVKTAPLVSEGQIHEATRGFVAMLRKARKEKDIDKYNGRRTVAFQHFKFLIVHNGLPALYENERRRNHRTFEDYLVSGSFYTQRVKANILPRSVAQTLREAFDEWEFTNQVKDYGEPHEICQLCEQERIRYHFEIRNRLTNNCLLIGSQCILKFDVPVYDERGVRVPAALVRQRLNQIKQKMRLDACLAALSNVARLEQNEILDSALAYYAANKNLSPKFAYVVFWRLQVHRIDHSPSFFKIATRRDRHRRDLWEMHPDRVRLLWPALSANQRELVLRAGYLPPQKPRRMLGDAAKNNWTYEAMLQAGWTDKLLIDQGLMTA
jgi:hypothetical protein